MLHHQNLALVLQHPKVLPGLKETDILIHQDDRAELYCLFVAHYFMELDLNLRMLQSGIVLMFLVVVQEVEKCAFGNRRWDVEWMSLLRIRRLRCPMFGQGIRSSRTR